MENLILCALTGLLFSNVRKFISIRRKAGLIDYSFTPISYLKMDYDVMFSQLLSVVAAVLCWDKVIVPNYPLFAPYAELVFVIFGAIGSEILNTFMSTAEATIMDKILRFPSKPEPKFEDA
jgi:hypothetical protein